MKNGFCGTILGIWNLRNQNIFQQEIFYEEKCYEKWWFDLVWWVKSEWGDKVQSMVDICRNPGCVEAPKKTRNGKRHWVWILPAAGVIKVNVDCSFLGGSGRGGIRGV